MPYHKDVYDIALIFIVALVTLEAQSDNLSAGTGLESRSFHSVCWAKMSQLKTASSGQRILAREGTRLRVGGTRPCGSRGRCSTPERCADAVDRV